MPKLKIYKASAGSGKTYTLVKEYLSILYQNPAEFKHILGVTFTNKSTAEMKQRIIKELRLLSTGAESSHLDHLKYLTQQDEQWVRKRARDLYIQLLHQYEHFHIQTIDSFFQQLIKGFAKDIGLSAGFNLEMNTADAIDESIAQLLDSIAQGDSVSEWLIEFASENIEAGKSWNIENGLKKFSDEVFRESFIQKEQLIIDVTSDRNTLNEVKKKMKSQIDTFHQKMNSLANQGLEVLKKYNLTTTDFKNKSKSFINVFKKVLIKEYDWNAGLLKSVDNIDEWYTKGDDQEIIIRIKTAYPELNAIIKKLIECKSTEGAFSYSAQAAYNYIYQLGILGEILHQIRLYRDKHDVILIPDTTHLIHKIIGSNDEAFIYEKTGNYFHHFLLDEFQDTSKFQWDNFKPLISNSISQDYSSMLVGDVKQSIYRFRNGDWNLLLRQAQKDIPYADVISLDKNFRSSKSVVQFNNTVFEILPKLLGNEFSEEYANAEVHSEVPTFFEMAYANQIQQIHKKDTPGYVFVKKITETKDASLKELALDEMMYQITDLRNRGYRQRDITILCRTSLEAGDIYNKIISDPDQSNQVISEQSLAIKNNGYVRILMSAMEYLADTKNQLALANMSSELCLYLKNENSDELHHYLTDTDPFISYIKDNAAIIKKKPPVEILISLHQQFKSLFKKQDWLFFQSLCDELIQYVQQSNLGIHDVVEWWKDEGQLKSIQQSDSLDAIRILTIHKSKGLEFPAVIIPFCDWKLNHGGLKDNILWINPPPVLEWNIPIVPVKYQSGLSMSFFKEDYLFEKFSACLDAFNLLYVALTRAERELYISILGNSNNKSFIKVGSLLWAGLNTPFYPDEKELLINPAEYLNTTDQFLEIGKKEKYSPNENEESTFTLDRFQLSPPWENLQIKKASRFESKPGDYKRKKGVVIHEFISKLNTWDDAPVIINELFYTGLIEEEDKTELQELVDQLKTNSEINRWFDGSMTILSERSIIDTNGDILRPDRLVKSDNEIHVIDFKTGKEDDKYFAQVKNYMNAISEIYSIPVSGFLLYTESGKIINVL